MTQILTTTDPRTGARSDTDITATTDAELDDIVAAAAAAAADIAGRGRDWRAGLLEAMADELEADRAGLVETAASETGLTDARLNGELTRTTYLLRLFAEAGREGSFLEAAIDHAGDTPMGAQPDVRRMLLPLGPVAVFGSSNFPFAFSVPGGDTASALAAGNPVIAKAHSAHLLTSRASYRALRRGAEKVGAPAGTIGIVYGQQPGARLVARAEIAAVGFTGSLGAASRLMEIIAERDTPIPFYGELQSVNPLLITAAALEARSAEIASGLAVSVTGSAGQLCTKPGVAFVPAGEAGERFAADVVAAMTGVDAGVLLNDRVLSSFREAEKELEAAPGVTSLLGSPDAAGDGFTVAPRVLRVDAGDVTPAHTAEAFGPLVLLVTYRDDAELERALAAVPDSLTVSTHAEPSDLAWLQGMLPTLEKRAGRLVYNGFPTGVRVGWAQHHGGPWPATNTIHTSVGITAIRRFLRPFAWQNAPEGLLPEELRDGYRGVPRRVDGALEPAQ